MDCTTISRSVIINKLLEGFPNYYTNEDIAVKRKVLAEHFMCFCTDCGGDDSTSVCKIEEAYFVKQNIMANPYYESFGSSVENVIKNTEL